MTGPHRRLWIGCLLIAMLPAVPARAQDDSAERDPHRRRSILYVVSREAAKITAFSRDTAEIIATIETGRRPSGLAARTDGDRAYVACEGAHTVQVIDGATRKILDTLSLPHGAGPAHLVLGPRDGFLYVAASGQDLVYVVDPGGLREVAEIPVGREPRRLAISGDGTTLYAMDVAAGQVDIIDTASRAVVASVPVGSQPGDIAMAPEWDTVYVVRPGAPVLLAIAGGSAQGKEISMDVPAEAIAVDGAARRLLLAAPAAGRIAVVSPTTGAAVKVIDAPEISRVVADPDGTYVYAVSARKQVLLFVNRTLGTVERRVPLEDEPWDLVLVP